MNKIFLVKCPNCGNEQKIRIRDFFPKNHYKTCVYCGKRFNIHKNPHDTAIIKEIGG